MWNYVYYSVYLDSIDTGDHNAIQKYVHEKVGFNDYIIIINLLSIIIIIIIILIIIIIIINNMYV